MAKLFQDSGPLPLGPVGPTQRPLGSGEFSPHEVRPIPVQKPSPRPMEPSAQNPGVPEISLTEAQPVSTQGESIRAPSSHQEYSTPAREPGASNVPRKPSRILCIVNRKGGVGKTTTTFNLAGALAQMSKPVLVIDLDPMGSLCRSLGIYPGEVALSDVLIGTGGTLAEIVRPTRLANFFVIPGDPNLRTFEMKHGTSIVYREALATQLNELLKTKPFEFVFIDCPPSLGLLSGNAMTAATEAIVPVDGSTYGMGALMDTLGILRLVRKNVNNQLAIAGLVLNNVNLGTVYDRTVQEVFKRRLRSAMFKSVIPTSPEADESSQLGEPVTSYAPNSWMSKAFLQLARELLNREPTYAG